MCALYGGKAETLFVKRTFRLPPVPPIHLPKTCPWGENVDTGKTEGLDWENAFRECVMDDGMVVLTTIAVA